MFIFYDVETTGFGVKDEVIEFSAIITDNKFQITDVKHFYCMTSRPISAGAMNVHGINKDSLYMKSGGKVFEEQFLPWFNSLPHNVIWIDWSVGFFDQRLINQTLISNGYDLADFGDQIISLKAERGKFSGMKNVSNKFGKSKIKLQEAFELLKFDKKLTKDAFNELCEKFNLGNPMSCYHTALYDSFITYCVVMSVNYV